MIVLAAFATAAGVVRRMEVQSLFPATVAVGAETQVKAVTANLRQGSLFSDGLVVVHGGVLRDSQGDYLTGADEPLLEVRHLSSDAEGSVVAGFLVGFLFLDSLQLLFDGSWRSLVTPS